MFLTGSPRSRRPGPPLAKNLPQPTPFPGLHWVHLEYGHVLPARGSAERPANGAEALFSKRCTATKQLRSRRADRQLDHDARLAAVRRPRRQALTVQDVTVIASADAALADEPFSASMDDTRLQPRMRRKPKNESRRLEKEPTAAIGDLPLAKHSSRSAFAAGLAAISKRVPTKRERKSAGANPDRRWGD